MLAQDGNEGLSVAEVARRAGVDRGTAYQHFKTREQLIEATAAWVSDKLYQAVFGDPEVAGGRPVEQINIQAVTERVTDFAMENPELGRAWLFGLLSSRKPANDKFWRQYESNFQQFTKTEFAQPGVDAEVVSVLTFAGSFLWPLWANSHARSAKERRQMAKRFSRELLRLSLHGSLRPEKYAELNAQLNSPSEAADSS